MDKRVKKAIKILFGSFKSSDEREIGIEQVLLLATDTDLLKEVIRRDIQWRLPKRRLSSTITNTDLLAEVKRRGLTIRERTWVLESSLKCGEAAGGGGMIVSDPNYEIGELM